MNKLFFPAIFVSACATVFAGGAVQLPLGSNWANTDGNLATPLGKVVYNIPDSQARLNLTYILQGANPNTNYTVGFNFHSAAGDCTDLPAAFGVPRFLCPIGTVGTNFDAEGLYIAGALETDAYGDGSFHINLLSLPPGTYEVVFWVFPGASFYPQAATGPWGGPFQTITIP